MKSLREALRRFTYLSAVLAVCLVFVSAGVADEAGVDTRHRSGQGDKDRHGNKDNKVDFWLTILHNNDGESQLINAGTGIEDFGGVAMFAALVKRLRKEGDKDFPKKRIVLTLNSGDNFLAGPEFNASQQKGIPFYDSIALNKIGYDAMALGNHEFDFGPDTLEDFILEFRNPPPFVSANLDFSQEPGLDALVDDGVIVKRTVIFREGEAFGVVGATTPLLPFISSPRDVIVRQNVAELVQKEIDRLTRSKVNKIIFISHLQDVNEDLALAARVFWKHGRKASSAFPTPLEPCTALRDRLSAGLRERQQESVEEASSVGLYRKIGAHGGLLELPGVNVDHHLRG